MSSMLQSYNTTHTDLRRNPYAPDLWIPYVLIGASCVTFLALHFWCYHKRNRERYLRQRDEKRLKFGLMERRRITTLVLARYQSDLGIKQSDTDIDLKQMYYDNCVDVATNDKNNGGTNVYNNLQRLTEGPHFETPSSTAPSINIPTGLSTLPDNQQVSSNITHSQTWPLVSECKFMPYNAHTRQSRDTNQQKMYGETILINKMQNNLPLKYSRMASYLENVQTVNESRFQPQEASNSTVNARNKHKSGFKFKNEQDQSSSTKILQPSSFSNSSSSVFYTNISSTYSTSFSQITPPVKRKHSKRRYNGDLVERNELFKGDQYSTTYLPSNKWLHEPSLPNSVDNDSDISVYENGFNKCFTHNSIKMSSFNVMNDGTVSTDFDRRTRGKVTNIPPGIDKEMVVLSHLHNNHRNQNVSSNSDVNKTISGSSGVQYENLSCSYQDSDDAVSETNIDTDVEPAAEDIQPSFRPQNILASDKNSTYQEWAHLNPSIASGKIHTTSVRESSTQTCLSTLHSFPTTRPDLSVSGNVLTVLSPLNDESRHELQSQASLVDQTRKPRSVPSQSDRNPIEADVSEVFNGGTFNDGDPSTRKTPRLRGLDPKLVFQHRKYEIKSEEC